MTNAELLHEIEQELWSKEGEAELWYRELRKLTGTLHLRHCRLECWQRAEADVRELRDVYQAAKRFKLTSRKEAEMVAKLQRD